MSSIFYQFTGASFDSIQSSLPSVPCTRCTHPLLVHQRTHPSHYLCDQRVLRLRGRVSPGGLTLPSPRLVDLVMGPENRVGFAAVIRSDSSYRLVGSEKVLEIEGARKGAKRRSGRLAGRTNVANETKEVETNLKSDASIFHQLTEFFNAALENAMPIDQVWWVLSAAKVYIFLSVRITSQPVYTGAGAISLTTRPRISLSSLWERREESQFASLATEAIRELVQDTQ